MFFTRDWITFDFEFFAYLKMSRNLFWCPTNKKITLPAAHFITPNDRVSKFYFVEEEKFVINTIMY